MIARYKGKDMIPFSPLPLTCPVNGKSGCASIANVENLFPKGQRGDESTVMKLADSPQGGNAAGGREMSRKPESKLEVSRKKDSYVYFISHSKTNSIRIGYTTDPASRFMAHRRKYGDGLELMGVIPGGREQEKEVHNRFINERLGRSEQFNSSYELTAFINQEAEWVELFCHIGELALSGAFDRRDHKVVLRNLLGKEIHKRGMSIIDLAATTGRAPGVIEKLVYSRRIDLDALGEACAVLGINPGDVLVLEQKGGQS